MTIYTQSESHNPDSNQADYVGANGVCPAQPGLARSDSGLGLGYLASYLGLGLGLKLEQGVHHIPTNAGHHIQK
jgi:hypothetical protein